MWLRACVVLGVAMFACGPQTAPAPAQPSDAATSKQGSGQQSDGEIARNPVGCPESFVFSMHDASCEPGSACSYPQAECRCVARPPCSGVDRGDEQGVTDPHVWACNVTDPTILRPDGCPAMIPTNGSSCSEAGRVCRWSPYCGGIQSTARCMSGTWQLEQHEVSLPPSMDQ